MGVTNESDVGLPPLSPARRKVWDYYRIEFLPDGYPGRRTGEILAAHPIYGPYVIADYLSAFRRTKDEAYLHAAVRVADAAVARMEPLGDALVFRYEPNQGISSMPHRFFSGLTQARYLQVFGRLHGAGEGDRFRDAARAVLRSLTIPASEGGVARVTPGGGTLIEEYTHDVPDYTLNGWTTATLLVSEYARLTGDPGAAELVAASRRGIADVLPLYDVPELANSRYRLAGTARVRLAFDHDRWDLREATVHIPGEGTYPVLNSGEGHALWHSRRLEGANPTTLQLELMLNRVTWPRSNSLKLQLSVSEATDVTITAGRGPFDPNRTTAPVTGWSTLTTVALGAGAHSLEIPIPWAEADLVAYPTSWTKRIAGEWFNQYHFIHVDTLEKLHAEEPSDLFDYFARKWASYPARWPSIPELTTAGVALYRFGAPPPETPDARAEPTDTRAPATPLVVEPQAASAAWKDRLPTGVRRSLGGVRRKAVRALRRL